MFVKVMDKFILKIKKVLSLDTQETMSAILLSFPAMLRGVSQDAFLAWIRRTNNHSNLLAYLERDVCKYCVHATTDM